MVYKDHNSFSSFRGNYTNRAIYLKRFSTLYEHHFPLPYKMIFSVGKGQICLKENRQSSKLTVVIKVCSKPKYSLITLISKTGILVL